MAESEKQKIPAEEAQEPTHPHQTYSPPNPLVPTTSCKNRQNAPVEPPVRVTFFRRAPIPFYGLGTILPGKPYPHGVYGTELAGISVTGPVANEKVASSRAEANATTTMKPISDSRTR